MRARARLFRRLPALALLLGLFAAAPAQAQTVWSATLTPKALLVAGVIDDGFGCVSGQAGAECSSTSVLTDDDFSLGL